MAITHSIQRTAPVLVGSPLSFLPALDVLAEAVRRRRIRRTYGGMSDAQLYDIGLTRLDVLASLSLRLRQSAGDAIAKAAAVEAARW